MSEVSNADWDALASRVARGMVLLDGVRPGWRDDIDLDQLDISSCTNCILGQLFGSYCRGSRVLFGSVGKTHQQEANGFYPTNSFDDDDIDCGEDLTQIWILALSGQVTL